MKRNVDITHRASENRLGLLSGPVLLSLALLIGACSSADSVADESTTTGSPVPTASDAPPATDGGASDSNAPSSSDAAVESVAPAACVANLPDVEMSCGHLDVPADYGDPDGDTLSLPYVVLPALGDNPSEEPLVFLQGGPGVSTMSAISLFVDDAGFRNDRDMIFLEQRGTDPSGLFLDCDPLLLDMHECYDGYVAEGIDLSTFTTLNAAKDLASLRSELDIEHWHLLGASYGTTLAMVAMDNDPEGTASVILDGPTAPDVIIYNADTESLLDAYSNVFDDCAADAGCSDRYPDLFATHIASFRELGDEPWNLVGTDLAREFGAALDHVSYLVLSAAVIIGQPGALPALVTAVGDRDVDALLDLMAAAGADEDSDPEEAEPETDGSWLATGLNHSIYCAEEAPFFDLDTNPIDTADEWPTEIIDFVLSVLLQDCEVWKVDPADPSDVDQIESAIPTLILAGEYDHTTPIRQGEIAAAGLSDVELIEVPSTGHTTLENDCARSIMADFLRAPGGDRNCLADIAPIVWL